MSNKENNNCIELSNNNMFYGISLPIDCIPNDNQIKVFDNKKDVLEAIKRYKGSRFKAFNTKEEAIKFSQEVIKTEVNSDLNDSNKNIEKSLSPFNGLHSRELAKLRKAIESDDYMTVQQLIWSNPRFLVSSGDTPVILMEGPRYNSCHIAAKADKPHILRLILNTVSDKQFMKLLFPFDSNEITESRINFLLDLYLNTPEKGFCETPLHFGCKFGSIGTVSVLLSFPNCDVDKRNKFGRKPSDIICERKGDKNIKTEILKLFETQIYVPLIRENDFSPQIGQPFKGKIPKRRVSGLAGPMSPKQAEQLFLTLKSPRKCSPNDRRIRLTDSSKGLERIARNLCKDMNINWTEFWPFLNTQIDLSSNEGLNLLEKHLRNVYFELDSCASKGQNIFKFEELDQNKKDIYSLSNDLSKLCLKSNISSNSTKDLEMNYSLDSIQSGEPSLLVSAIEDETDFEDSFSSALSSPTFLFDFYINGAKMTREDIDAALALQHIINTDRCLNYDFIQNWFQRVYREQPQHFDFTTNCYSPLTSSPIKRLSKY